MKGLKKQPGSGAVATFIMFLITTTLVACGTFQVGIEGTATVELGATSNEIETLAASETPSEGTSTPTLAPATTPATTAAPTATSTTPPTAEATTGSSATAQPTDTPTVQAEGETLAPGETTATVTGVLPIGPFEPYDSRETPFTLLASYYNAINREEYQRAYGYWRSINQRLESFAGGFGETAGVIAAVQLPYYLDAAAGNRFASIPTLVLSSQTDASQQAYIGCIIAWSGAEGVAQPPETEWWLDSRTSLERRDGVTSVDTLQEQCQDVAAARAGEPFDQREDPISLIGSYYNAINREEYERAYSYWEQASESYEAFVAGFANTSEVVAVAGLPFQVGAAAGSRYAEVPVLLTATHTDGTQANFVGCFTTRRANTDAAAEWSLYSASILPSAGGVLEVTQLVDACAE